MTAYTWTGAAGDGNYGTAGNWSPAGGPPGLTDTATINVAAATAINASNGAALSLTTNAATTLNVSNQSNFTFGSGTGTSTFSNGGTLALNSSNQPTDLIVGDAKLTLSGSGTIVMSDNGGNAIVGAAAGDQLINTNNLIEGGGQIGAGTLTLTNSAGGTILADDNNALIVNTGTVTVSNAGLMEATGSGGLVLQSAVSNGTTGHVTAAGGNVYLQGASIKGGTLSSSGGAGITVQTNNTGTLDGTSNAVANTGLVAVNNQGTLSVLGSIVNTGTIALQSTNQNTDFAVGPATGTAGTVTLSGTGTLLLSDNGGNRIYGAQAGDTLVNATNVIAGAGALGVGTLTLVNHATIDATGVNTLVVNTGSTVVNTALMEATNPSGGLVLQATVNDSTTGTLLAAGANIYLQSADILGGLLNSNGTGAIVVQTNQTGTLDGTAGHVVTNMGQLAVNNQGTLSVLGTLTNKGTVSLQSGNQVTSLIANSATVTLNGGGVISLSDNTNNYIYGAATTTVLNNVNNTIRGAGQIGDNQLTLINSGTINATGTGNALYLNGDTLITNKALIEATGTAGLYAQNTTIDDSSGGTLFASGSDIFLQNTTVKGGLLKTGPTAAIDIQSNQIATLNGVTSSVTNSGSISIENQGTLTALGTLVNNGTISLNSNNQITEFVIGSPTLTLTGGGSMLLSNNGGNFIVGSAAVDTLNNVNNTIAGAGQFGDGQLTLINAAAGTINANQSNTLTLSTGGSTVTNAGLIESTSTGGLLVLNTVIANTGTINANGGNIILNGGTLAGGLLNANSGGQYVVTTNTTGTLDGSGASVTLAGNVAINNQATLSLLGGIINEATIALQSSNQNTDLIIGPATGTAGTVTLGGSGTVLLSDNPGNRIYGAQATDTLFNANNLIEGAGQIGASQLTLINDNIIDATGTNALVINTGGITAINAGLMEATNSGGLVINSAIDSSSGGTILAAGGDVYLDSGSLIGGVVNSSGGAVIDVRNSNTGTLDGSAHVVTSLGTVAVNNQSTLSVLGSLVNAGVIALNSTNQNTDFIVGSSTLTLTGGGTLALSDNGGNRIYGASGTDVLDNINNTIVGGGQIGAGQLTLINAGIIDASGGNALTLNTGSVTATNTGLMEATNSGGLVLNNVVDSSGGGTILAAGGNVYLDGGTLIGGTLNSSGGAVFNVRNDNVATLDGSTHTITNLGTFLVNNQSTLSVLGSLANSGLISINSTNQNTDLIVNSAKLTLSGGGTLALSDNGGNRVYGAATADVFDNVDNTIEGAGQFGVGQMTLIDAGIIEATGSNALHLNLGSTGTITATGQLLGIGSGGLSVENGTYTNSGTIQADNGSNVTFQAGAVLTNNVAGTLKGGTYGAVDSGNGATLSLTGSAITTDAATDILLSGAGATILSGGTNLQSSLATIALKSELQIAAGANFASSLNLIDRGTLALAGGTITVHSVADQSGALVSGYGKIASTLTGPGAIVATGGTLDLTGAANSLSGSISGSGTLSFDHSKTTLAAGATLAVSNVAMINFATLALSSSVSFGGTFDAVGKETINGTGTFTNTGLFEHTGTGSTSISAPFQNTGSITIAAGGGIAFSGGLINNGSITDLGTFTDTQGLGGGSLAPGALSIGPQGSKVTLGSAAGAGNSTVSTLTIGGGKLDISGTTLTVTGDYINSRAGSGNVYTPFAGVTGTIDGQGTALSVVGVNGTTIENINGQLTIEIAPGGTASFRIKNSGATGSAKLRGALQTTVNGGNITASGLSGNGVTASSFAALGAGGASGTYNINYSGGTLSGQAIHIATDFANVGGLTIDIVAAPGAVVPAFAGGHALSSVVAHPELFTSHHG